MDGLNQEYSFMPSTIYPVNFIGISGSIKFSLQVTGSRTKIFIVLEFITGGELFDKIVSFPFYYSLYLSVASVCVCVCVSACADG